jgi:hypothetical protein
MSVSKSPASTFRMVLSYCGWFVSSLFHTGLRGGGRNLVLVSGADSSHYLSLVQFLRSAKKYEGDALTVVWDLGLTAGEAQELKAEFPETKYRKFPFAEYPNFFDISVAAGEYAWKPAAIKLAADEFVADGSNLMVLWCDAGNLLFRRLKWVRRYVAAFGVFSPFSTGTLRHWTHPMTAAFFDLSDFDFKRRNANGALAGFDLSQKSGRYAMERWYALAQQKDVIAPEGSSRANHRQDQAVLSCILVTEGLLPDAKLRTNWTHEYRTNCDVEKGKGLGQRWETNGSRLRTT